MFANKDGLMEEIRDRFEHVDTCPVQGKRIFFENAGGALTLKSVVERSTELAKIPDNQGRDNPASYELVRLINQAKEDIRSFLGAAKGPVFVGESGTELLFRLISTAIIEAPEGGNVVGSTLEHPASVSACARWSKIANREFIRVPHNDETGSVSAEDYRAYVNADTRVATILHTSPVTGMAVDVASIAKLIREVSPDCYIIIDGIQHAAHGGLDIDSYDIDGYAISPYKVFSRHGYGIAWVSERLGNLPHNSLIGAPADQWDLGTRDTASYATFSDVVNYFDWLGAHFTDSEDRRTRINAAGKAIHAHEKALTDAMLYGAGGQEGLASMSNVFIIGGIDNPLREGLVSLAVEGKSAVDVVSALREKGIRTHARKNDHFSGNILGPLGREDCVRVSMCHYNTEEEVADFLAAMKDIAS
ncbi:MAG: aminotransferase class V-fold PLP-dependent enzyme [Alphaproteobacteria bacterium]|jgi:cysteine desulfurase / selenocysteine lyase|nr:aminotransferase class V-fold PLP-dependent enzyme [Alphaproteobacteria bacterium]MBT4019012.1 aminotransferase class V-fold PLP-dependent enzyme [Alphaproteobacteria bacterium]MBT4965637.1 aminotransferase class V-fold PLP-dependent enzyme [Alphaproteobacteria bacterium]MBT5159506.1 aminotransferase class V-fold PLP-dependent enzyme [Alphaproteobacteria bacterium]MBT6386760.1 aminotransferase class V-fold PLP-dependent enzyme [Alphaproteobacteria bacterium]